MSLFKLSLRFIRASIVAFITTTTQAGTMGDESSQPWSGFYASALAGEIWTNQTWNYTNHNYFNTIGPIALGTQFDISTNRFAGGGALGFNYQAGQWVPGIEASILGTSLSNTQPSPFFSSDQYTSDMNALAAIKGKFGYASAQWFVNLNTGIAVANIGLNLVDPVFGIVASSSKQWNSGPVVGLGLDRKLTNELTLGISYDYINVKIRNRAVNCPLCGTGVGFGAPVVNSRFIIQSVLARLTYMFNQ